MSHADGASTFRVPGEAYDRFMGRYSEPLAGALADVAGVESGQTALNVGCGPGAQTGELVRRLGAESVWAIGPVRALRCGVSLAAGGSHVPVLRNATAIPPGAG